MMPQNNIPDVNDILARELKVLSGADLLLKPRSFAPKLQQVRDCHLPALKRQAGSKKS